MAAAGPVLQNESLQTTNEEVWKTEVPDDRKQLEFRASTSVYSRPKPTLPETVFTNPPKPLLPPKPVHGPPSYREPPRPFALGQESLSSGLEQHNPIGLQQPDVCALYSSAKKFDVTGAENSRPRLEEPSTSQHEKVDSVRIKPFHSGMQAWAQETKTTGNVVGERLNSLQKKLRSLLTQSQKSTQKEITIEEMPKSDHHHLHRDIESSETIGRASWQVRQPEGYISQSALSSYSSSQSAAAAYPERHPFEPDTDLHESEGGADTVHLRDTCNKLFSREPKASWSSYVNPRNSYTNNIKSATDYDKLTPKQTIGRSCQEIKALCTASSSASSYPGPLPSSSHFPSMPVLPSAVIHQTEPSEAVRPESTYHSSNEVSHDSSAGQTSFVDAYAAHPKHLGNHQRTPNANTAAPAECGDASDQYKSSSESGRGTMHSNSLRDTKSQASARSSRVSGASHLDTSLDSDQSNSCALWENSSHFHRGQGPELVSGNERADDRQHYENSEDLELYKDVKEMAASASEDTLSKHIPVCPPPRVSSPHSSPASVNSSPPASTRTKYKLSSSTTALSSHQSKLLDSKPPRDSGMWQKSSPYSSTAPPNPRKKSGTRNPPSSTNCRQWGAKSKLYTPKTSSHRAGHSCKKTRSPPTVRHSSSALAVPSYVDYGEVEWTSTTTGLDGESLLDDQDDLSSDISMSTSTMDPVEMVMIRKQLEGLESMYSEIVNLLGGKGGSCKALSHLGSNPLEQLVSSRCGNNRSLPSVLARSSSNRGAHPHADKRGLFEKRKGKELRYGSASKRLQRLESHVVTLARSVAHLSSEMRTHHLLVQELEHMRQDITWVSERLRLMQLAQGYTDNPHYDPVRKEHFRKDVSELLNPDRAKKLTKFFGDEPPLIRQFLKRLGYEKYASNFETEKIGIMELPYLTEERLQKIGVPMGPRMRILQEARAYCQQSQYKVYIV